MPEREPIAHQITQLHDEWLRALHGDSGAQSQWHNVDSGDWSWSQDGLHIAGGGGEWFSLMWNRLDRDRMHQTENFVVAVTIQGKAQAAGISFGPFRDFLTPPGERPVHLQFEVDAPSRTWRFRVDGRVVEPAWWNSAVANIDDIMNQSFALKARHPEGVTFRGLAIHAFAASCRISIILTCNRFLQRLRFALRNWCHQDSPSGMHEVLVVNPVSPDGTHEHLRAVTRSYPEVRIGEIVVDSRLSTNKGAMINHAIQHCRGEWIWLSDSDCVFPANAVSLAVEYAKHHRQRLLYGQRRYLTNSVTEEILSGRIDCLTCFEVLARSPAGIPHENSPWGYTQIVQKTMFDRLRYPETFSHYAHGDSHFIDICKSRGIKPEQIPGMFCLHLEHPFAWFGNSEFL